MGTSTSQLRAYSPVLSEVASSTVPSDLTLIADKVLPKVQVDGKAYKGQVWVESRRSYMGQPGLNLKRTGLAKRPKINSGPPTLVDYSCEERGPMSEIPWDKIRRSQFIEPLVVRETKIVVRAILIDRELDAANLLFDPNKYNASNTAALAALPGGSGVQVGGVGATEVKDLLIARNLCRVAAGGTLPDSLTLGWSVFDALRSGTDIRGYIGDNTNRMALTDDAMVGALSTALGIPKERIFVGSAMHETANPGQTSAEEEIWGDSVLFHYSANFSSIPVEGGAQISPITAVQICESLENGPGITAYRWDTDNPPATCVAAAESRDEIFLNVDGAGLNTLGFLVTDCVA